MGNLDMQILNGVTFGALLFMVASGFTIVFGLMRITNLTHGTLYLLGAYVGLFVRLTTGNWLLAIAAGGLVVALVSVVMQNALLRWVQGDDLRETLLTLGVSFILADVILAMWGGVPKMINPPSGLAGAVQFGSIYYPAMRILVLVIATAQGIGLWLLLTRTQFGRIIRAGVDDRQMVSALGIDIWRVFTLVFILAGTFAGLSGVIGGSYLAFQPGTDLSILTYALVVVIIGGMGSVGGAALGALAVGLIDSFSKAYVPQFSMLILFSTLMIVLAFRPQGLLGKES